MENDTPRYELAGITGQLKVFDDKVVIERKGLKSSFLSSGSGNTTIRISDIKAVQSKHIDMTSGYIRFATLYGGHAQGGVFSANADENTIMFSAQRGFQEKKVKALNQLSDEIVAFVESKIEEYRDVDTTSNSTLSAADELKKFKELLDSGVITQEEFDAKKKQLLGL